MKTDPARKAWLASLKPGDLVMIEVYRGREAWLVARFTKRAIFIDRAGRVTQQVSRATGEDSYTGTILPPTSLDTIEWKRQQVIDSVLRTTWSDVSLPTLRRVAMLLDSPLGKRSKPASTRGAK